MKDRVPQPQDDIDMILKTGSNSGTHARLKRRILAGALALAVAVALFMWGFSDNGSAVTYQTQPASRGDLTVTVSATGNLEPTNQVDVGSERSGIVKIVEADFNDQVRVGQVLAQLDTSLLEAEVRKSEAALESAQAKVLQAQATVREAVSELDRMRQVHELTGGRTPAARDLDAAEASVARARADEAVARAQVLQARATLEANRTDLSKALIRSPINGIVLARSVEPGQTVAASLQAPVLFTLAEDLASMELHVDLDEADVGRVQPGQRSTFTVDAYPGRVFSAEVAQVRYSANNEGGVVTYKTVLTVDNTSLLLRPGMTATADITVHEVRGAVLVPNGALRYVPGAAPGAGGEKSGVMSKLMPGPPRRASRPSRTRTPDGAMAGEQRVWTLRQGSPVPIAVTIGETDGIMTEIVAGDVTPGMELIIGAMGTGK
jgi:HlyD family secretion protein